MSTATTKADLVSLEAVREAAERVAGVAIRTPLLPSAHLTRELGADVRLKCENFQPPGSFKIRGAYNFISRLDASERDRGIITYSSGNHAQAVAYCAAEFGVRAVVVMPTTAPAVKREGTARWGAEVILEGTTSLHRKARAEAIAEAQGLAMIPPFDDPVIIAGQGTAGLEVHEDFPEMDTWVCCIGGGGLASGTAVALRALNPGCRLIGVEPVGAASMRAALDAGGPVPLPGIDTIADGLAPIQAGGLTFRHVRDLMDDVVTVGDEAIRDATSFLLREQKLVVEFSGAATVAAIRCGAVDVAGRKVGAMISGGNLDPSLLSQL
jgi:threonine dehydratase